MDAQRVLQAVEHACDGLQSPYPQQRKEGESVLMQLRQSKDILRYLAHILENTPNEATKFHVLVAANAVVSRSLATASLQELMGLRSYVLTYVTKRIRAESGSGGAGLQSLGLAVAVNAQIAHLYAILSKGSFVLGGKDGKTFASLVYGEVAPLLAEGAGECSHRVGLELASSLGSEFLSPSMTGPKRLSISTADHFECMMCLERDVMYDLCQSSLVLLRRYRNRSERETKRALCIISDCLQWEFLHDMGEEAVTRRKLKFGGGSVAGATKDLGAAKRDAFSSDLQADGSSEPLQPGARWLELLLGDMGVLRTLFEMCAQPVKEDGSSGDFSVLADTLIRIASLSGSALPSTEDRTKFASLYLQGLTHNMASVSLAKTARLSQMVLGLLSNVELAVLLCTSEFRGVLASLTNVTSQSFQPTPNTDDNDDFEETHETESLLRVWIVLIRQTNALAAAHTNTSMTATISAFASELGQCTSHLFECFVTGRLASAAMDCDQDEEYEDEELFFNLLTSVAYVARFHPSRPLLLLSSLFAEKIESLKVNTNHQATSLHQEQLYWLVMVAGFVLADDGCGETPTPPLSSDAVEAVVDVSARVYALLEMMVHALNTRTQLHILSPLLGKAVAWFVERWVKTYLLISQDETRCPRLLDAYGPQAHGPAHLHLTLTSLSSLLLQWPGEDEMAVEVCKGFRALAAKKQARTLLLQSEVWMHLVSQYGHSAPAIVNLQALSKKTLVQALVFAASGAPSPADREAYLVHVLNPTQNAFEGLVREQEKFVQASRQPDVINRIIHLMETCRGIVVSISGTDVKVFALLARFFGPMIGIFRLYKDTSNILVLVVKFFSDLVATHFDFLPAEPVKEVLISCTQMIEAYRSAHAGVSYTSIRDTTVEIENYRELYALTSLLNEMADHLQFKPEVTEVVFVGLNAVLPMLTISMLQYPKLCEAYYKLIHAVFRYPERLVCIPAEMLQRLLQSLEFGLKHHHSLVVHECLESIYTLASASQASSLKAEWIQQLVQAVLDALLNQELHLDLLSPACDALYALIAVNAECYQRAANQILSLVTQTTRRDRMAQGFFGRIEAAMRASSNLDTARQKSELARAVQEGLPSARSLE